MFGVVENGLAALNGKRTQAVLRKMFCTRENIDLHVEQREARCGRRRSSSSCMQLAEKWNFVRCYWHEVFVFDGSGACHEQPAFGKIRKRITKMKNHYWNWNWIRMHCFADDRTAKVNLTLLCGITSSIKCSSSNSVGGMRRRMWRREYRKPNLFHSRYAATVDKSIVFALQILSAVARLC